MTRARHRDHIRSAAVLAALGTVNVLARRGAATGRVAVPVGAAALLLAARASGLTWAELGVDPGPLRRDLRR
ncbi:MAG TPA: CPBP family intramembrane metalloprotease, partial [Intrasporangiaceae bacterium]|nr:CPBP family intramembrane metalloprotease [Intrasporangiaceae bacterium]